MDTLGNNGMFYNPPISWSLRYSHLILISLTDSLFHNIELSVHVLSLLFGVLTIPFTYIFVARIFDSRRAGLFGAFLMTVSFFHTAWSGYVMYETMTIFFIVVSLSMVAAGLSRGKHEYADYHDIIAGVFASLAVMTRIEYLILIFPVLFLYIALSPHFLGKSLTFLAGLLSVLSIAGILGGAIPQIVYAAPVLLERWPLLIATILLWAIACVLYSARRQEKARGLQGLESILAVVIVMFLVFVFITMGAWRLLGISLPGSNRLTAILIFSQYEYMLAATGIIGIALLLKSKRNSALGIFALLFMVPLALVYNRVNPVSYRYCVHYLPALIIGSSFLLYRMHAWFKGSISKHTGAQLAAMLGLVVVTGLLGAQVYFTVQSMRSWQPGTSYEKAAALKTKAIISQKRIPKDTIVLTFMAEPYYYYTGLSSWRALPDAPYTIKGFPKDKPVLIVIDESTRDQLPRFASHVANQIDQFKIADFKVGLAYYFRTYKGDEKNPVALYYIPANKVGKTFESS